MGCGRKKAGALASIALLSVLFTALLSVTLTVALDVTADISPASIEIKGDREAIFDLSIKHNSVAVENFEIYTPDVEWDLRTDPQEDKLMTVKPNEQRTTKLILKPLYVRGSGYFVVPIHIRVSGKDVLVKKSVVIGKDLISTPKDYVPGITITPAIAAEINPSQEIVIDINIKNRNIKELNNVDVKVRSNLINNDFSTQLTGLSEKTLKVRATLDPKTMPQSDTLTVTVFVNDGDQIYRFEANPLEYRIISYGEIAKAVSVEKSFLKTVQTFTLENTGNARQTDSFRARIGFFSGFFTDGAPAGAQVKMDDGRYLSWSVDLGINEKYTIIMTTNYRPFLFTVLLIVIIAALYFLIRSPVTVTKSAVVMSTKEGGISEFKVLLEVKNRSGRILKGITLIDKIPKIAEIEKNFELGTLKPTSIMHHDKRGTLVKWTVDELDRFEDRIITYRIKSRLSIFGSLELPVAVVRFEPFPGRERSATSNKAKLGLSTHQGKIYK